jgi:hypothetical protein
MILCFTFIETPRCFEGIYQVYTDFAGLADRVQEEKKIAE